MISGFWGSKADSSPLDDALLAEFWIIVMVPRLLPLLKGVFEKSKVDWRIWAVGLVLGGALFGSAADCWP